MITELADELVTGPAGTEGFVAVSQRMARGVAVITTGLPGTRDQVHGMTADSLATVSVRPPMISVGLRRTARTLELLRGRRAFAVSVLADDQTELASRFASRRRPAGAAQFDGIGWRPADSVPAPLLTGAVGWFEVVLLRLVAAGDHVLVLADVLAADAAADGRALVRADGLYR